MFTYLNPEIRNRLMKQGKWAQIDAQGRTLDEINYISSEKNITHLLGPVPLPIHLNGKHHTLTWYASAKNSELRKVEELADSLRKKGDEKLFSQLVSSMTINSIFIIGDPVNNENPLVRVHSNCFTGDIFGSERCECGPQLRHAIEKISTDDKGGIIIYMAGHEGRGIGLWAKAATYLLQDAGEDTYQANKSLGLPEDSRDFSDAATLILYFLGNRPLRLLTNNPKKVDDLQQHGITHIKPEGHIAGINNWNKRYMQAKKSWGHKISEKDL